MSSAAQATRIAKLLAREVFDSRGNPTVEVEIHCAQGPAASAIAPSGASKGQFEAIELRDSGEGRLRGLGVRRAVAQIRELVAPALIGADAADQAEIDRRLLELDGTPNKSRLGGNATTAVSIAAAHAAAAARGILLVEHLHDLWQRTAAPADQRTPAAGSPGSEMLLPLPMVNMISGGLHAGKNLDFQDVLILPVGAESFSQALDWIVTVYHALGRVLRDRRLEGTLVGDEGGYGPKLSDNALAVEVVVDAIEAAGFTPGRQIAIGLDVAATHLVSADGYRLEHAAQLRAWSADELVDLFDRWVSKYPIVSIEDPLAEQDYAGWRKITERLGRRIQLVGDDLFVTNSGLLQQGIDGGLANSVLIKFNQIGTLSETFATMRLALAAGYRPVVSARSGETEDATIADLAVATGAGQIKIGSVARSERLAKYNQLLRLEERLQGRAAYAGGRSPGALRALQSRPRTSNL